MARVTTALLGGFLAFALAVPAPAAAGQVRAPAATSGVVRQRVNLAHFDHLFAEATVEGERVGVLRIYSEAPDYRFAIEPREGDACVDDVARGMVLLAAMPRLDPARLRQLDLLTRFVLRLQADNGYFHNFVWNDGRINREYRTSLAELNWWSLRALWGLEAALQKLPADSTTARRARQAADRLVANLKRDLPTANTATATFDGVDVPGWLPFGSGADAASTALLALVPHYQRTRDAGTRALIVRLGEGLVRMQAGDAQTFPHGAHLSWRNQWHGWGNAQAYALLRAGALLGRPDFTKSALAEVDGFYPYLLRTGMLSSFTLAKTGGRSEPRDVQRFPQIAYGISPMVLAANEAFRVTGERRYRDLAHDLARWFAGSNDVKRPMYDPATGRAYDGIVAAGRVNRNSGAESTIEALFALTVLQGTPLP
ncbi:hypothetical protein SAMN06297144_2823 [Sphingomonas guangdongensis]|uniref:Glycosyl hydrolase n=1 Tax=Sphingomonas guangdongensis TaxID=1141890 RepID=A0A285R5S5_9SPHN|nr:hypothetical protein [Sphingomonas guangdongensis]SOB87687.1 hypothetical protein SAMN06297144_2823 [Sphingomonas guangdongensis]